jgi:circadian clock protein KaiC
VSSLIDTWLLVRDIEMAGERNRGLYVLKSRGMPHSNQIREFVITDKGLDLVPVYVGLDGNIFIGAARVAKESEERVLADATPASDRARAEIREERKKAFEAQIEALRAQFAAEDKEFSAENVLHESREKRAARKAEQAHRTPIST